jgi:hypothetical protein
MDNKLNLMVNFMGVDKLSGSMKNIMMTSKSGGMALKGMKDEARKLETELKQVRKEIAAGAGNMTQLINRERQLEAATAGANAKLDAQAKRLTNIRKIESRAGKISGAAGNAGAAMSIGVTAPAMMFGQQSMQAYLEAQDAAGQVEASLASMGRQSEFTSEKLGKMARGEMKKSLYDDDQILRDVTAQMLTFGNVQGAMFGRAQAAAVDLSVKFKKDLGGSAIMVGKALQDPIKGVTALTKVGVSFSAAQKTMIKSMVEAGDKAGAQRLIMAELEKQVAGSAEAARKANPGAVAKQNMDDMQESVGGKLMPIWMKFLGMVGNLADKFNNASPAMQNFIVYAGIGVAVLGPLLLGIAGLVATIGMLAGPLSLLAGAPAAFAAWGGITRIVMGTMLRFQQFKSFIMGFGPMLARVASLGAAGLRMLSSGAMMAGRAILFVGRAMLMNPIGLLVTGLAVGAYLIYTYWDQIKAAFFAAVAWLSGLGSKMMSIGTMIIQGLVNGIRSAGSAVWNTLKNIVMGGINGVKALLGIKSPSRVFMALGGYVSEGMAVGIDKGGRRALGAAGRLATGVASAGALALSPVAAANAGGVGNDGRGPGAGADSYNFTINVYARDGQSAQEIADEVIKLIERKTSKSQRGAYDDG